MESIINKNKLNMTLLKKIDIGTNGYFEKGVTVMRMGFLQSLQYLIITPILHRNMNRFMGSSIMDEYICYQIIRDKVCMLRKNGVLQTWNLFNGKFEQAKQMGGVDWAKFELHSKYKRGKVLIRSKDPLEGENDADYFFDWQLTANVEKCKTFQQATQYKYRRWYYLDIVSPDEVKVVMEFKFPNYAFQRAFINETNDRMI